MEGGFFYARLSAAAAAKRTPVWILLVLAFLFLVDHNHLVHASSWSSWGFSSGSSSEEEKNKDESVIVSPIVNRQLETSVKAHHWPRTPQNVFCEAFAYHSQDDGDSKTNPSAGAAIAYLDRLVQLLLEPLYGKANNDDESSSITSFTYESAKDMALQAFDYKTGTAERGLLEVSLALRSGSPLCETHRSLARQALIEANKLSLSSFWNTNTFAVVYPAGLVLLPDEMSNHNLTKTVLGSSTITTNTNFTTMLQEHLLPGEAVRQYDEKRTNLVILYGNFGTKDFVNTYQQLVSLQVPLVVRYMGVVHFEEDASLASPTALQGYGVRLDIRNVEYKVFDDRRDRQADGDGGALVNLTANPEIPPGDLLAGIDLEKLGLHNNVDIKQRLWQKHEEQQGQSQKVPPVWQRRQLPLQASTVISQAEDPLSVLAEVSQNLPSVASLLVNVKIPEEISQACELMESEASLVPGRLYVNGRKIFLDSPSFNVFEILNIIRKEQASLRKLEDTLGPFFDKKALRLIQDAWIQGESFEASVEGEDGQDGVSGNPGGLADEAIRIDVGRGWKNAIIYLNDIEKDAQYSRWPRSVKGMLQSMQFGMPPVVRRNMFTILSVLDPIQEPSASVFQLGMQLIQNSYPARVGVLWVNQDDMVDCQSWLRGQSSLGDDVPCPVKPIFSKAPSNSDLSNTKATTQAAHQLLVHVVEEYDYEPQVALAFTEYMLATLEDRLSASDGDLTMRDLIDIYTGMVEIMGVGDTSTAEESARESLLESASKYGHALRFAVERNLRPGMGFLNGRPLVGSDPSVISKAFGEEQQHIFGLIMQNEITDTAPKSVYAMLLSGNKVFKKVHPLLFSQGDDTSDYMVLEHDFGPESLLFPRGQTQNSQASFVAEIFMPYSKDGELSQLVHFLGSLKEFPSSVDASSGAAEVSVGYRILPASREDADSPLCPLFARASAIGLENISALLGQFAASEGALSFDQLLSLLPDESRGSIKHTDCGSLNYFSEEWASKNMAVVNGRRYEPEDGLVVSSDDMDLLLSMEYPRARAVQKTLREFLSTDYPEAVDSSGKASAFLGVEKGQASKRNDIIDIVTKLERRQNIFSNPLRFRVPGPIPTEDALECAITVVLDPVSEAAQRISSFLVLLQQSLNLSIDVILSPASLIDGDSKVPITSYYRFVADVHGAESEDPVARFSNLPTNHLLTIRMDVPEPWDVQQTKAVQDTDNLRCDHFAGCSDSSDESDDPILATGLKLTSVEYGLSSLLIFGQCYEPSGSPPNGLQLVLTAFGESQNEGGFQEVGIEADGAVNADMDSFSRSRASRFSDTLVMKTVGYWQLRANAGVWYIKIAEDSKGASMFDFVEGTVSGSRIKVQQGGISSGKKVVIKDFVNRGERLFVQRKPGLEHESLFFDVDPKDITKVSSDETIHVFSLATGHLYERFLKIMMLSVTKRTSTNVKFWLFENFLSPTFKATAKAMAKRINCEVEFVTYKWPEWLRGQSEKQRIIWGYKILFLDVLFPLDVKKIIYVDADQVVRGDLKELWDMDLKGAPYGYTPFCTSRESTLGYQFWRDGFWKSHLQGKPYHISALYVVDLETFRRTLVGDQLRATYQQLSADPNSLSNLDQDLPNYAQHQVPIFSLPQEWLWCESWCSDETKATAKTIDLCNNPMHKEPKVSMAKRVISGPLFNESWVELDAEVEKYEKEYFETLA